MMKRQYLVSIGSLTTALVAVVSPAYADDPAGTVRYTVKKGDTCVKVAAAVYKDSRGVETLHSANPQLGKQPHYLAPGIVLVLPPLPPKGGPDARVKSFRNQVVVQSPTSRPAKGEDPLFRGNKVATATDSSADVRFKDDSRLGLGEETLVVILGTDGKYTTAAPDATLVFGTLRARLGEAAKKQTLATEAGSVAVGGETQVSVDKAKTAIVSNYTGKATVTAQKKSVVVPENYGTKAEKGKAPTAPKPLPPVPTFSIAPTTVVVLAPGQEKAMLSAGITKEATPLLHHVQIAREDSFSVMLGEARVPAGVEAISIPLGETGDFFFHASAVDAEGFEGKFTQSHPFSVVRLSEEKAAFGLRQFRAPGAFCSIDNGPFVASAQLPAVDRSTSHSVRCAKSADGAGATGATVSALPAEPFRVEAVSAGPAKPAAGEWVRLHLTSLDGAPVVDRALRVAASDPAVVLGRVEKQGNGYYAIYVNSTTTTKPYMLRVALGDEAPTSSNAIAPVAPEAAPAPVAPSRQATMYGEIGAGISPLKMASGFGGMGFHLPVGAENTLAIGFRVGAEFSVASRDSGITVDGNAVSIDSSSGVTAAMPIAFRFGTDKSKLVPYIGLTPNATFQTVKFAYPSNGTTVNSTGHSTLLGGDVSLGLGVAAGPGTVFGELGFRAQSAVSNEVGYAAPRAMFFNLGYRLGR